ncbi:hypothetical protein BSKO_07600 [Bryopsis sp. KO-2023]|nr:hypothetical protein BSKO_07600 [Bryopsis sp. KO-2023]
MTTRFAALALLSLVLHTGQTVIAQSDFDAFLDSCENEGQQAGAVASRGACAGLLNRCPVPVVAKIAGPETAAAKEAVPPKLQEVLDRTCDVLFVENCRTSGTSEVFRQNFSSQDCRLILELGPGEGAEDCQTLKDAVAIFGELLDEICEATPAPTPEAPALPPPPAGPKEVLLSRGKPSSQSSTILGATSDRAVDGDKNSDFSGNSCTHTGRTRNLQTTLFPWWSVDLGSPKKVTRVEVTNRSDCCAQRLDGFDIHVGDIDPSNQRNFFSTETCASGLTVPAGETVSFDCPVQGQYVTIRSPGFKILTLCEVEVFGEA